MRSKPEIAKYVLKAICENPTCPGKVFSVEDEQGVVEAGTLQGFQERAGGRIFGRPKEASAQTLLALSKTKIVDGPFICPHCLTVHTRLLSTIVQGEPPEA